MKDVVLVTISLNRMAGGLEKNIVWLANSLNKRGFKVTLLTFDSLEAVSFYVIEKDVSWEKVGISEPHQKISIFKKIQTLLNVRLILKSKNNCTIIVFHHGILARILFSSFGLKSKIICSERNALSLYKWVKKFKWNLNFILLFFVDLIVVQFRTYINDYPIWLRKKIIVISNPVAIPSSTETSFVREMRFTNERIILNVGRLSSQKNQDILIREFKKISSKYLNWKLYIVGNGELDLYLKELISKLNLSERVFIIEPNSNIRSWYKIADIYCMPSRWEGFPNALAEALSYGIPSVGLLNCDGINQLIINNFNGYLCDIQDISIHLEKLILDEELRKNFGHNAKNLIKKYDLAEIESNWVHMIEAI